MPAAVGPESTPFPLFNTKRRPSVPPSVPVPQYVVLNRHAATHSAQLATPTGDVLNVDLSGYIKLEDGTMIKAEPGVEVHGSSAHTDFSVATEPFIKTEPDNEYPGEVASNTRENKKELEIIKEILKPTDKEQIEVVLAEDRNDANAEKDAVPGDELAAVLKMELAPIVGSERTSVGELTDEEDEEDSEESSADEYQPDSDDSDSAEEEEDMDWKNLAENIGNNSEDILGSSSETEPGDADVDVDMESLCLTGSARRRKNNSVSVLADEKLTKMKPVVELTDIVQQILSGNWTL